jgi:protein-S-isoprenylcysteine O-methyltransferase Ste14
MAMLEHTARRLVEIARRPISLGRKLGVLVLGIAVFFVALPLLYVWLGRLVDTRLGIEYPVLIEIVLGIPAAVCGFVLMVWSVAAQWRTGRGTPAPVAPTEKLIVTGPYELCRNPMQLGVILYHWGAGTLLGTLTAGVIGGAIALIGGTLYHRLVEERELELRFGDEYRAYKANTPYLCPRLPHRPKGRPPRSL